MTPARKLLYLPFWLSVLMACMGSMITFLPGAEVGWLLAVATLSVSGMFIPKLAYRVAAVFLLLLALRQVYPGHRRGVEYRQWILTNRQHFQADP